MSDLPEFDGLIMKLLGCEKHEFSLFSLFVKRDESICIWMYILFLFDMRGLIRFQFPATNKTSTSCVIAQMSIPQFSQMQILTTILLLLATAVESSNYPYCDTGLYDLQLLKNEDLNLVHASVMIRHGNNNGTSNSYSLRLCNFNII